MCEDSGYEQEIDYSEVIDNLKDVAEKSIPAGNVEDDTRVEAVKALGSIGTPALPTLADVARSTVPAEVRKEALQQIQNIEGEE